jgi:hypothetical protein
LVGGLSAVWRNHWIREPMPMTMRVRMPGEIVCSCGRFRFAIEACDCALAVIEARSDETRSRLGP